MNTLRKWLRRAVWYCFFALIVNVLIAAGILYVPVVAFMQHILATAFSIIVLIVAVVILMLALDSAGWLFEAGARARAGRRSVCFLVGVVLVLLCIVLVGLLLLRLHQSFGNFLLGSDAFLMQVEIMVIGALAWRQARLLRIEQQKKP